MIIAIFAFYQTKVHGYFRNPMIATSKQLLIASFGLIALITGAYWNHFDNPFHFDDSHVIVSNAAIKDIGLWKTYFTDASTHSSLPMNQGYRPLLTLSFAIDHLMAGGELDPVVFHISTYFWFVVQLVLMFLLYRLLMDKVAPHSCNAWASLFAVGIYGLHTVNAETLNYISARSDVLSTVPVVAGILIFASTKGWKRHLALVPVAAGILVKQTAVMYLPILLAYVALFEVRADLFTALQPKNWAIFLKWSLPAAVVCIGLFLFTQKMTPETWVPGGTSAFHYAITQPFVILRYFWLFFLPYGLSADSDWTPLATMADARFVIGMLFLGMMAWVIVRTSRSERHRPIAFGLLWFLFALVPTSSIIPLSEVTNDHRMFYPYVGLVLAMAWPLSMWAMARWENAQKGVRVAMITAVAVLYGAHATGVVVRNKVWSTDETLWLDVTIKSPDNGRGLMNYGLSQMNQGNYARAMKYYQKALQTSYRNHPYLYVNMANAQYKLGNIGKVEALYKTAIEKGPGYPDCHYFYARWLLENDRVAEAAHHAKEAVRLSPSHEYANAMLAAIAPAADSALQQAEQRAQLEPTPENYLMLSLLRYRNDDFEGCIAACHLALALRPAYADAWNNICSAYNAMGQWQKGIAACQKALELEPDYELASNNLKWARQNVAVK